MTNLLLITDVARLRKIFGRLTEDKNIRLRVVNNLEKGGEEITIEKPDVVFVQTHLSGLSADILIMHLKKQLGRKRTRFVLLASPAQTNAAVLKPYQGWIDTSAEDSLLLSELQRLLVILLSKPKKNEEPVLPEPAVTIDSEPQPESTAAASHLPVHLPVAEAAPSQPVSSELQPPVAPPAVPEPSLVEQGVTYAPRQRLTVYSKFNSSFDNAVSSTPDPETLEQATPPPHHDWNAESIDTAETKPARSKRGTFLLWLAPVIIAVVVITYLQQQRPAPKPNPPIAKTATPAIEKPSAPVPAPAALLPDPAKATPAATVAPPAEPQEQERMSDKAVLTAIAVNREKKVSSVAAAPNARLTTLPKFIPVNGLDKQYGTTNPGWELYRQGEVTEFKVLRKAQVIKAIQVIDRGGQGVSEAFMKRALRQVTKNPAFSIYTSEKKEGFEIQRGLVAENIKVVYYRDGSGGKLRAFVLTWQ